MGTYRWRWPRMRRAGVWQRWTGSRWQEAAYAAFPERMHDPRPFSSYEPLPTTKQERLLEIAVELEVLDGADVVHRGPDGVVLAHRRRVNHLGHGLLTLLTGGVWGFVWVAMCLARREDRVRWEVDAWGSVWTTSLR